MEDTIGLAVIDFAWSALTLAPEISRRTAAAATHEIGESAGAFGEVPPDGSKTSVIRFAVTFAIWTVVEAGGAGCAVVEAVDGEPAGELADVDGDPGSVEPVSAPADDDGSEKLLEGDLSSPSAEESVAAFGVGWPAVTLVRGFDGFGFGVLCDGDPEPLASVGEVLLVLVDDVVPEGLLVVGLSSSFVEEPLVSSVAVSVPGVDGFGFGVLCDGDPEPLASVGEVLLVLVDDDAPEGLLDVGL